MPFTIPEHERERNILQKRLKLLTLFDQLLHAGISLGDLEDLEKRGTFADFSNVLNPCDLCDSIKSIYRPEQYAPPKPGEAKAAGVYKGRPATIDAGAIRKFKEKGKGATEIAKEVGNGPASVCEASSHNQQLALADELHHGG